MNEEKRDIDFTAMQAKSSMPTVCGKVRHGRVHPTIAALMGTTCL